MHVCTIQTYQNQFLQPYLVATNSLYWCAISANCVVGKTEPKRNLNVPARDDPCSPSALSLFDSDACTPRSLRLHFLSSLTNLRKKVGFKRVERVAGLRPDDGRSGESSVWRPAAAGAGLKKKMTMGERETLWSEAARLLWPGRRTASQQLQ